MNSEFLSHRGPTDVITFDYRDSIMAMPGEVDPVTIGEIFVCPDVAQVAAVSHGNSTDYEVLLYLVHGILHLAGYDDHADDDIAAMRAAESRVMDKLLKTGPVEGMFL